MANERKLYMYNPQNDVYSDGIATPGAVLTVPIESFDRTPGCTNGVGRELLVAENIGKHVDLKILDPVPIGSVEFCGVGQEYIPESIYNEVVDSFPDFFDYGNFATFKQGDEYIIVDTDYLDVEPLF